MDPVHEQQGQGAVGPNDALDWTAFSFLNSPIAASNSGADAAHVPR